MKYLRLPEIGHYLCQNDFFEGGALPDGMRLIDRSKAAHFSKQRKLEMLNFMFIELRGGRCDKVGESNINDITIYYIINDKLDITIGLFHKAEGKILTKVTFRASLPTRKMNV